MAKYKTEEIKLFYQVLFSYHQLKDDSEGMEELNKRFQEFEKTVRCSISISDTYLKTNLKRFLTEALKKKESEVGFRDGYIEHISKFLGFQNFEHFQNTYQALENSVVEGQHEFQLTVFHEGSKEDFKYHSLVENSGVKHQFKSISSLQDVKQVDQPSSLLSCVSLNHKQVSQWETIASSINMLPIVSGDSTKSSTWLGLSDKLQVTLVLEYLKGVKDSLKAGKEKNNKFTMIVNDNGSGIQAEEIIVNTKNYTHGVSNNTFN